MKKIFICLLFISIVLNAQEYKRLSISKITQVSAYHKSTAAGDILIKTNNLYNTKACEKGLLLLDNVQGLKNILSLTLSAYYNNENVQIDAYTIDKWRGASSSIGFCVIEGIHLIK